MIHCEGMVPCGATASHSPQLMQRELPSKYFQLAAGVAPKDSCLMRPSQTRGSLRPGANGASNTCLTRAHPNVQRARSHANIMDQVPRMAVVACEPASLPVASATPSAHSV